MAFRSRISLLIFLSGEILLHTKTPFTQDFKINMEKNRVEKTFRAIYLFYICI